MGAAHLGRLFVAANNHECFAAYLLGSSIAAAKHPEVGVSRSLAWCNKPCGEGVSAGAQHQTLAPDQESNS